MDEIRDILLLQKREIKKILDNKYIKRENKILELDKKIIKVVIGPRRAGKSTFIINELNSLGSFSYVNFDDERLINIADYDEIILSLNKVYDNSKIIFFDEIQNLKNWELFVNRLSRQGYNIVISGSNSNLLSKDLATHLTGRYLSTIIFPLSFREYLNYYNYSSLTTTEIKQKFSEYVKIGGFPEPLVLHLDYNRYLNELYNSILLKDIVKKFNIKYISAFENLSHYLVSNIASLFSYSSLVKITDIKSVQTIQNYIGYLEEAFLFFKLNSFSYKVKEQINSKKKIYSIDNGLINSKTFSFSENIGKLFENLVGIELKKRELSGEFKLFYYKNYENEEIDFLIKKGNNVAKLIQVCYDVSNENTLKREVRSLIKAGKDLKCNDLIVLTNNYEKQETKQWFNTKAEIKFIPIWKWLIQS